MKKIGIVTFHNSNNYGALLQAYALQSTCKLMGYDVELINYAKEGIKSLSPNENLRLHLKNKNIKLFFKELLLYYLNNKKFSKMNLFRKKFLNLSNNEFSNENDFRINAKKYDYLIVGSDQVWNLEITKGYNKVYFLEDSLENKKIAYAASTGGYTFVKSEKRLISNQLSNFSHISVREKSDKEKVEELAVNKEVFVVLDPTLLLLKKDWEKIININKKKYKEKYILVYTVEPNKEITDLANKLSNLTGYVILGFTKKGYYNNKYKSVFCSGVEDFLNYFYNADYIVTNSFHGTVFSLIFKKNFWVVNHKKRGDRIKDLLKICELENRIVTLNQTFDILSPIDTYDIVNNKIEKERQKSIQFLKHSLDKD